MPSRHAAAAAALFAVLWVAAAGGAPGERDDAGPQDAGRRASLLLDEERLFLRGCAGDRACAAKKHAKLQAFRESRPDVYRNLTSGAIDGMIRSGAVLLNGETCSGNAVFVVRNRLFDWDRSSTGDPMHSYCYYDYRIRKAAFDFEQCRCRFAQRCHGYGRCGTFSLDVCRHRHAVKSNISQVLIYPLGG